MKNSKKYNHQIEINDLIDDAIVNAVTRRGLLTLSEDEATSIAGGLTKGIAVEEIKLITPICPPPKPICPPIVAGMIVLPKDSANL